MLLKKKKDAKGPKSYQRAPFKVGVVEDTLSLQPRETGSDQSSCGSLASKPTHFWKSGVAVMELDQSLSDVSDRKLIQTAICIKRRISSNLEPGL